MKVSEFIGIRVVDNRAMELGKVSEVVIEPKKAQIIGIHISTGEFGLRRKELYIKPSQITEVGDYILLNVSKEEIPEIPEESDKHDSSKTRLDIN